MRNYDEWSDFQINVAVTIALDHYRVPIATYSAGFTDRNPNSVWSINPAHHHKEHHDYCNNPNDAWPIIESIWWKLLAPDEYGVTEWARHMRNEHDKDKLRAACIVFLKMKEQDND